jgi:anti-anti-sigma factor
MNFHASLEPATTSPGASMPNEFSTEVRENADAIVIYVRGEIDMATAGRLRDAIEPHLGPEQTMVLDLSGVEFMDSQCLHVLLKARSTMTADGGSLILRNPSQAARNLLSRVSAERFLVIEMEQPETHTLQSQPSDQLPRNIVANARPFIPPPEP